MTILIRLPDAPAAYTQAWGAALVRGLSQTLRTVIGANTMPTYPKAALPSAADFYACTIYVVDGVSNKHLAVSDGTNWRWPDGTIVS